MKTVKGYLVKRGKTYLAEWTIGGKRFRQSTKQTNKSEAKKALDRIMAPFLSGNEKRILESVKGRLESVETEIKTFEEQRNPPLTFAQAWPAYLQAPSRPDSGKRTLHDYEGYFQAFMDWLKKHHPDIALLRDVTASMVDAYARHLNSKSLASGTFNKHIQCLALIFRVLASPARLSSNPWNEIQRKRAVAISRRELTVEELRRVCEKATGEMRLLLALGIYTGLRLGDVATLRWGEVDLVRGIIRRIPNKTERRNPKPVQIPIHHALRAMLAEIPEAARREYVLPETADSYLRDSSAPSKRIQAHFAKCDVTLHKPGTGFEMRPGKDGKLEEVHTGKRAILEVGFHSLRHTFVSLCRAANAPLAVVESIVGHSSPAMTRHYTHTGEAAALEAVSALPSLTGEPVKALPLLLMVDAVVMLEIVNAMTAKNWKSKKVELIELAEQAKQKQTTPTDTPEKTRSAHGF